MRKKGFLCPSAKLSSSAKHLQNFSPSSPNLHLQTIIATHCGWFRTTHGPKTALCRHAGCAAAFVKSSFLSTHSASMFWSKRLRVGGRMQCIVPIYQTRLSCNNWLTKDCSFGLLSLPTTLESLIAHCTLHTAHCTANTAHCAFLPAPAGCDLSTEICVQCSDKYTLHFPNTF